MSKKTDTNDPGGANAPASPPPSRVHKINDLLHRLPASQRSSLVEKLSGTAPQLLTSQLSKRLGGQDESSSRGPIDTPMRRAKSLARQLIREANRQSVEPPEEPKPALPLDALRNLARTDLTRVYRSEPLERWLTALKIAEPELKEHLLLQLSARESAELEDALRELGPIKLSDAQAAAEAIMRSAQKLADQGEIRLLTVVDWT